MTPNKFDLEGLEAYQTDKDLESIEGIWLEFPGNRRFHVLRAGGSNTRFVSAYQAALRPYRKQLQKRTMDPGLLDRLTLDVYARHVIKGWEGITSKGQEIPYTVQACIAFFSVVPEMFDEVMEQASDSSNFSEIDLGQARSDLGES